MEERKKLTVKIDCDASDMNAALDAMRKKAKKLNKELEKALSLVREISFRM